MNFAIIRVAKLKTLGAVGASGQHTFRERPTPNADSARTVMNKSHGAENTAELLAAVKGRLPEKHRKDAVVCAEYLITASPEWFEKASPALQERFFKDSVTWLQKKHGTENVVCTNLQLDEKSPHLVAYVVPRHPDGRLSAKEFFGGRDKLRKMQTDFWKDVGARYGLERGVEGSKARHTTVKEFYAALTKKPDLAPPEPPPEPSPLDVVTGKALKEQREYAAKLARHAAQVEKAAEIAKLDKAARQGQAKAIKQIRGELAGAQAELAGVKQENAKLKQEVTETNRLLTAAKKEIERRTAKLLEAANLIKRLVPYLPEKVRAAMARELSGHSQEKPRDRGPSL